MYTDLPTLFEEIKNRGLSVAKFATITGIPAARIYKWQQGHGSPKMEDMKVIQNWMEERPNSGPQDNKLLALEASVTVLIDEMISIRALVLHSDHVPLLYPENGADHDQG